MYTFIPARLAQLVINIVALLAQKIPLKLHKHTFRLPVHIKCEIFRTLTVY